MSKQSCPVGEWTGEADRGWAVVVSLVIVGCGRIGKAVEVRHYQASAVRGARVGSRGGARPGRAEPVAEWSGVAVNASRGVGVAESSYGSIRYVVVRTARCDRQSSLVEERRVETAWMAVLVWKVGLVRSSLVRAVVEKRALSEHGRGSLARQSSQCPPGNGAFRTAAKARPGSLCISWASRGSPVESSNSLLSRGWQSWSRQSRNVAVSRGQAWQSRWDVVYQVAAKHGRQSSQSQ
jgi:hypothetical protein